MPLFKHNKNRDTNTNTANTGYPSADTGHNDTTGTGYNNAPGVTGATGTHPQGTLQQGTHQQGTHQQGTHQQGAHQRRDGDVQNDPLNPSSNAPGGYNAMAGGRNDQFVSNNNPYEQQGYGGGGGGTTGAASYAMAPQNDASGNPVRPKTGGAGNRMAGKVESAVGTMFGSESLKQKGLEREHESQALKVQAAELSEAERLEKAALARRERAVAHGAHPDHKYLGSQNPSAGATNVNELGGAGSNTRGGVY